MFVHLVSIWKDKTGNKAKVWQTAKEGYAYEVDGKKKSNFFGPYEKLVAELKNKGYREITSENTVEDFVDNVISEAAKKNDDLKPGGKKPVKLDNVKLSPEAAAALTGKPESKAELAAIKAELKKHAEEYAKLNALLNKARLKKEQLQKKAKNLLPSLTTLEAKYFSIIDKECSEYVKVIKQAKEILYRGSDTYNTKAYYGKPHEKRKPMDTHDSIQAKFDAILDAVGFKAKRSNSVFCTSDYGQASNYGNVFYIFPKNGFSFTWSTKHGDWVPSNADLSAYFVRDDSTEDELMDDLKIVKDFNKMFALNIEEITAVYEEIIEDGWDSSTSSRLSWLSNKLSEQNFLKIIKDPLFKKMQRFDLAAEIEVAADDVGIAYSDFEDDDEKEISLNAGIKRYNKIITEINLLFETYETWKSKHKVNKITIDTPSQKKLDRLILYIKDMDPIVDKKQKILTYSISKLNASGFIKKHGLTDKDLVGAIKKGNEVYLNGEYVALEADTFKRAVNRYYLGKESKTDDDDDDAWFPPHLKGSK